MINSRKIFICFLLGTFVLNSFSQETSSNRTRARDLGVLVGKKPTGKWNAITDVPGVKVGHTTLHQGREIHTGVTVVLPHGDQHGPFAIVFAALGEARLNELKDH